MWNDIQRVSRARRVSSALALAAALLALGFGVHGSGFGVQVRCGSGFADDVEPDDRRAPERVLRVGIAEARRRLHASPTLPMETYVARVLAGEAVRDSQPAALEALAITIRTFALANRGRHRADGFDLCDQTHCQVVRAAVAATERAAQATAGRLLLRERRAGVGLLLRVVRRPHRSCRPTSGPAPTIRRTCRRRTTTRVRARRRGRRSSHESDLQRALRASGFAATLRDLRIASRNASGRVARLTLDGLKPDQISGQDFRVAVGRTLGWQHVKSTAFELRKKRRVVPVQRSRVRPRRRHVRHRLGAARRARGQRRGHPGALLPRPPDLAGGAADRDGSDQGRTQV